MWLSSAGVAQQRQNTLLRAGFSSGHKSKMSTIRTLRATLRSAPYLEDEKRRPARLLSRSASRQKARSKTIIEPQNVVPPVIHMYWNQYLMLGEQ